MSPSVVGAASSRRKAPWKRLKLGSGGQAWMSDATRASWVRRSRALDSATRSDTSRAMAMRHSTRYATSPRVIPMFVMNSAELRDVLLI